MNVLLMLNYREQLLDYQCNDVDICLEGMMGVPFAERFVAFLSENKHVSVHKITKIESNPDQSKHLETARTTLFGIDLDFVNLRSEEYSDHSRIPTEVVCSIDMPFCQLLTVCRNSGLHWRMPYVGT